MLISHFVQVSSPSFAASVVPMSKESPCDSHAKVDEDSSVVGTLADHDIVGLQVAMTQPMGVNLLHARERT